MPDDTAESIDLAALLRRAGVTVRHSNAPSVTVYRVPWVHVSPRFVYPSERWFAAEERSGR